MSAAIAITGVGLVLPGEGGRVSALPTPEDFAPRALRRVSRLGRLALPAAWAALRQSGLEPGADVGLVLGTGLGDLDETAGFLRDLHARGPRTARPQLFQRSVHAAAAGELAILLGLTGHNLTVTEGLRSGLAALYAAALAVRAGRCRACLCVAADTVTDALVAAGAALGAAGPYAEAAAAVMVERDSGDERALAVLGGIDPMRTPTVLPDGGGWCGAAGLVNVVRSVGGGNHLDG